jgi:flagellin FlaB
MIVFIALILVAAVAAAVIIQTAEQLQQNAQKTGEDTADNMAGKVMINSVYVDTNAAGEDYLLYVRLAPGSEATTTTVQEETNMDKWLELWLDETMKETEINNKEEKL